MAATVVVDKKILVSVGGSVLGYTRNGVEISANGYFLDVPGDENGGDDGPPIDVQYLGETVIIRLEMTKWDPSVAQVIESRVAAGTGGVPAKSGTLMFGDSKFVSVLLASEEPGRSRTYPRCIIRGAIQLNKGTKFSTFLVEIEAHKHSTGDLWTQS